MAKTIVETYMCGQGRQAVALSHQYATGASHQALFNWEFFNKTWQIELDISLEISFIQIVFKNQ